MPRKAALIPNEHIHTTVPKHLGDRLRLFLFSEVEGRVPQGAYQSFFSDRIAEFFDQKTLDLAPFTGELPGFHVVRASSESLTKLIKLLKGEIS